MLIINAFFLFVIIYTMISHHPRGASSQGHPIRPKPLSLYLETGKEHFYVRKELFVYRAREV